MKKRVYTLLCTAVVFAFVFTACMDDKMEQSPSPNGGGDHLTLSLATNSPQTKSVEEVPGIDLFNENKIISGDVFFYEGNILRWHALSADNNYDASKQILVIPVPEDKKGLFDGVIEYNMYVVANNTAELSTIAEGDNNLGALNNLVFQTSAFQTNGGVNSQESFVMDGMITKIVDLNVPDLGTVNLKRAASKIRLNLVKVDVEGYTYSPGATEARLVHFTDKSVLLDGGTTYIPQSDDEWLNTDYRVLSDADTTVVPFYAYANDWTKDATQETYLELRVPLTDDDTNTSDYYVYRIPITPQDPNGKDIDHMNMMERNFFYDIEVNVNMLGGDDNKPVDIEGNYTIIDWSSNEVVAVVKAFEYLVLSEYNLVMPNITSYSIKFNSSIPNVTLVDGSLKVSFTNMDYVNGVLDTLYLSSTDDQWALIDVEGGKAGGLITVNSKIPVNYRPKDIIFQVTNGLLTQTVTIQQLPVIYLTAEIGIESNLRDVMKDKQENPSMYIITTLAPKGDIIWGFPPRDSKGYTENSLETAKMVSPKFMMASQWGVTDPMDYEQAVENCSNYWEKTVINGHTVTYDDWRLPTEAEIKFIDDLSKDLINNPLGYVMVGKYYWDAYSLNDAYTMKYPYDDEDTSTINAAYARCIRDIIKD